MPVAWPPTRFKRFEKRLESSTRVAQIVTDAGRAYVKCLGNPEGPHCLACDWIGVRLAESLGLPTFSYAQLIITADDLPFDADGSEQPGPAFATQHAEGFSWDGKGDTLTRLVNPDDLAGLILLDTLLRNPDRMGPDHRRNLDNVFLETDDEAPGDLRLIAMDYSHCIGNAGTIHARIADIDRVKDPNLYGLFDAFKPFLTGEAVKRYTDALQELNDASIEAIINEVPQEWELSDALAEKVIHLLVQRRNFLVDTFFDEIATHIGDQAELEVEQ